MRRIIKKKPIVYEKKEYAICINGSNICVHYIRNNNRTERIKVNLDKTITISTPRKLTEQEMTALLAKHSRWLFKALNRYNNIVDNNTILFFGKKLQKEEILKNLTEDQLQKIGQTKIQGIFNEIKNEYKFKDVPLIFFKGKSKWGYYNSKKNVIGINVKATMLDYECLRFLILHEFAHTKVMAHNKAFYDTLSIYCPNHKELKKQLRQYILI